MFCVDLDECTNGELHLPDTFGIEVATQCRLDLNCFNEAPYFRCCYTSFGGPCACPTGYYNSGNNNVCYPIFCNEGYEFIHEGNHYVDRVECSLGTHTCTESETCVNNEGSFTCQECPIGYAVPTPVANTTIIETCEDIDECALGIAAYHQGVCIKIAIVKDSTSQTMTAVKNIGHIYTLIVMVLGTMLHKILQSLSLWR